MSAEDLETRNKLLWQVNLFNGNIEALLNDEKTPSYMEKLDRSLLMDFLKLKVEFNSEQKALFYNHFTGDQKLQEDTGLEFLRFKKEPI